MGSSLISLCGAPGSGKSTIAQKLADFFNAKLIEEDYSGNPFLAESYNGSSGFFLPAQLWFLLSRVNQLSVQHFADDRTVVSDYAYIQDEIYAELLLDSAGFAAYRSAAEKFNKLVVRPKVTVLLDGSTELLLSRVKKRGRSYEDNFGKDFLSSLAATCRKRVQHSAGTVITVDIDKRDLLEDENFDWLCQQIRSSLKCSRG